MTVDVAERPTAEVDIPASIAQTLVDPRAYADTERLHAAYAWLRANNPLGVAKVDGFDQVPFDDAAALEAAVGPETAALMIEPIQGEGGIRPVPSERLRSLRAFCDARGLLLIFDEIQTGVGRTGALFACDKAGVAPDIMSVAKGIGGGFPMVACLATREAAKGMVAGTHGTTYGGNPLAMAVGNAVLDVVLAPGFLDEVARKGLLMRQRLAALQDRHPDIIAGVRGEGLMLGLITRVPPREFVSEGRRQGILTIPAANDAVRLLPPLTITDAEIEDLDSIEVHVK